MSLYFVRHQHSAETCPAKNPEMGEMLVQHVDKKNARKFGVDILSDAVLDGQHTFVLIVEAEGKGYIEQFMQPFAMAGSVDILPASTCEAVAERLGWDLPHILISKDLYRKLTSSDDHGRGRAGGCKAGAC